MDKYKMDKKLDMILKNIEETNTKLQKMEDDNKEYRKYAEENYKKIDLALENLESMKKDIAKILDKVDEHDTDINKLYQVM